MIQTTDNEITPFRKLRRNQVNCTMIPKIQAMMTGVVGISQDRTGLVTLTYTDCSTESAVFDREIYDMNVFQIVSAVQAQRKATR